MGEYRSRVKGSLMKRLLVRGFEAEDEEMRRFEKVNPRNRDIVTYTLYDKYFIKHIRCQPLKEGWSEEKFLYTYDNVAEI